MNKPRCQHDIDRNGIYTIHCVCGREISKVPDGKGGYTVPWNDTDPWCKHCLKAREM